MRGTAHRLRARRRASAAAVVLLVLGIAVPASALSVPDPVEEVLDRAAPVVEPLGQPVQDVLDTAAPVVEPVVPVLEPVQQVLDEAAPLLDPVREPLQEVLAPVEEELEPVQEALPRVELGPLQEPVDDLVEPLPLVPGLVPDGEAPQTPPVGTDLGPGGSSAQADGTVTAPVSPDLDAPAPADGVLLPPAATVQGAGGSVPAAALGGSAGPGPTATAEVARPPALSAFAAEAVAEFRFPLLIMAAVILFLLASGQLVPRDRKALARAADDPGMEFA